MKNSIKKDLWIIILMVVSLIGVLIVLPTLPSQVPMHWDIHGEVDNYGSKISLLYFAALPFALYLLFMVIPVIDPRKKNYDKHEKAYRMTKYAVVLMMIALNWIIVLSSIGMINQIEKITPWLIGVLFIVIGNYMRQIRSNFFFGIKNPWTLSNELVWKKTHRVGGIAFVATGLGLIIGSFFGGNVAMVLLFIGIIAILFISTVYSYLIFRKVEGKQ